MQYLSIISFLALATILYLLMDTLNLKNKINLEKAVRNRYKGKSIIVQYLDAIERLISFSGVNISPIGLTILGISIFIGLSIYYRKLGFTSVLFGCIGIILLFECFDFLGYRNKSRIRALYSSFVSLFGGYYATTQNVVETLKSVSNTEFGYISKIIRRNVTLYEKGLIGFEEMFDRISLECGQQEYFNFFQLVKTTEIYGGNLTKALEKMRERIIKNAESEAMMGKTNNIAMALIYFMILLDIISYKTIIDDPDITGMLQTTLFYLPVLNFCSIVVALIISRNIRNSASI